MSNKTKGIPYVFQSGELQSIRLSLPRPGFTPPFEFLTKDNFDAIYKNLSEIQEVSYDTETTSLYYDELVMVSFSFAYDRQNYVCLVNHVCEEMCFTDFDKLRSLTDRILTRQYSYLFNSRFDLRVAQKTFDLPHYSYSTVDVQSLVFLADTNVKMPNLKDSAYSFLGIASPTFEEAFGPKADLQRVDPQRLGWYSAFDSYNTLHLGKMFRPELSARYTIPYTLDRKMPATLMYFEDSASDIDINVLHELSTEIATKTSELQDRIYSSVGVLLLTSPVQIAAKLTELGYDTGARTKTGQMATGIDYLRKLEKKVPFVKDLIEYKKLVKLNSSYVQSLIRRHDLGLPFRFHYITNNAPTMRLAAGSYSKSKKKAQKQTHYFVDMNIQGIAKPVPENRRVHWDLETCTLKMDVEDGVLTETGSRKMNLRRAWVSPSDEFIYWAIDYSGQELRIASNLSMEPVWVNAFLSGGDPHKETAIRIWGLENYDKSKRKKAKIANFGCPTPDVYLNTNRGLLHPQDLREGDRIFDRHGNLQTWKQQPILNQDCYRIKFSSGLIETYHENHRFLCFTPGHDPEWVEVKNLTPEHRIVSSVGGEFYCPGPTPKELDPSLACATGVLLARPGLKDLIPIDTERSAQIEAVLSRYFPEGHFAPEAWTGLSARFLRDLVDGILMVASSLRGYRRCLTGLSEALVSDLARVASILSVYTEVMDDGALMWSSIPLNGTRVLSMEPVKETIFTLQTENHEYLSSYLVSHNTVYGGGVFFLMNRLDMTELEAMEFQQSFRSALPTLFEWTERVHEKARKFGYVISPYGLPRRLSYYYRYGRKFAGFADRSAVNTLIQGSAGIITRLALTRLFENIAPKVNDRCTARFYNDVFFRETIHDEIGGICRKSRFKEFAETIIPLMINTTPRNWVVPMDVELSVGNNWGELVALDHHQPHLPVVEVEEDKDDPKPEEILSVDSDEEGEVDKSDIMAYAESFGTY